MRFLGPWMLLKGILLSTLISSPANAIDLDLSNERMSYRLENCPPGGDESH